MDIQTTKKPFIKKIGFYVCIGVCSLFLILLITFASLFTILFNRMSNLVNEMPIKLLDNNIQVDNNFINAIRTDLKSSDVIFNLITWTQSKWLKGIQLTVDNQTITVSLQPFIDNKINADANISITVFLIISALGFVISAIPLLANAGIYLSILKAKNKEKKLLKKQQQKVNKQEIKLNKQINQGEK